MRHIPPIALPLVGQAAQQAHTPWWVIVLIVAGVLALILVLLYLAPRYDFDLYVTSLWPPRVLVQRKRPTPPVTERVRQLSASLTDALDLIGQIQQEIQQRTELVSKLEADIKTASELADLKHEEVEAVAQVLRGELTRQERRSFRMTILVNLLFFVLGAGVSFLLVITFH